MKKDERVLGGVRRLGEGTGITADGRMMVADEMRRVEEALGRF